jgi:hypothetical protein
MGLYAENFRNDCQAAVKICGSLAWEKKQNRHLSVLFFLICIQRIGAVSDIGNKQINTVDTRNFSRDII